MSIVQSRARMRGRRGMRTRKGGRGGFIAGAVTAGRRALGRARPSGRFRGRAKGITARELRGFRKITNLLRKVGMVPKGLRRAPRRGR